MCDFETNKLSDDKKGLEQDIRLMQAINQASFFLLDSDTNSFAENLFQAMNTIALAVKVDRVYIWKNRSIDGKLHCTQVYEWSENVTPQQDNEYTANIPYSDVAPGWEEILSQGKSINSLVRDMAAETRDHLTSQGIISILVMPVFLQGCFWGFVGFDDCRKERLFNRIEEMVLRSCSLLFAHAYQKNEIYREIYENHELNRLMFNSMPIGLTIFDDNYIPQDCNEAILAMYGGISKEYYFANFSKLSPEYQPDGAKSQDKVFANLRHALLGEHIKMEWMHCSPHGELIPCEVTLTGTKIGRKYVVLGYTYDLRRVKDLEVDLAKAKDQIYFDPLTGIYNRRYLDEALARIMRLSSRSNAALSVLMLDIDYFKNYNDTYGHNCGDICLKKVADIMAKSLTREDDFVARFGGEEFVIVLPNTDEHGARLIAEKILVNIRNANILHEQSQIANHVTISIGAVSGKMHHTQTQENYIVLADKTLYASKQNGRDRYTFQRMI